MDEDFVKRVQEATPRFRAGESDVEEVESPSGLIRLVRDSDAPNGFRLEAQGERGPIPVGMRFFAAAHTRPEGYPSDLPFLEACAAMVNAAARSVSWMEPAEPEAAFARLVQESVASGWQQLELHPVIVGAGGQQQAEFKMPGKERTIMLLVRDGHARLTLMDRATRLEAEDSRVDK